MYAGAELDVVVYEFVWNSVYEQAEDGNYYWKIVGRAHAGLHDDRDDATTTVWLRSSSRRQKSGQYQVTATGDDDARQRHPQRRLRLGRGRAASYVAWPQNNNDRIELVADKKLYAPGDTAKILVPNPFSGPVKALVTMERSGVLEQQRRRA